jgi:uncharacterized membrane protein YqjE
MAQTPDHGGHGGLYDSLKGLAATGVAVLQTRLELLSTELAEEKERLLTQLILGLAALFFIGLGIVFAALFLTVALWENHRLLALGMFTALFLGLGAASLVAARNFSRNPSRLFSASLAELAKDRDHLTPPP